MRSAKEWLAHCETLSGGATERSVSAHVLRHSRATDLIERTGKVKGVARMLGHASEATTLRYYVRQCRPWEIQKWERHSRERHGQKLPSRANLILTYKKGVASTGAGKGEESS